MASPFLGMNPYLEHVNIWHDFHKRAMATMADSLSNQLDAAYIMRINQHEPCLDGERQSFLEIRDRASWKVITVIELLSPTNKNAGPDREQYLAKRLQLLNSWVHLVEIDLLRGGPRMPVEDLPPCDYVIMVSRWEQRPRAGLWPIALRDPLPVIPIPLTAPTPDVPLNLQEMVHRVYDAARYVNWIYTSTPEPLLSEDDAEWAKSFQPR